MTAWLFVLIALPGIQKFSRHLPASSSKKVSCVAVEAAALASFSFLACATYMARATGLFTAASPMAKLSMMSAPMNRCSIPELTRIPVRMVTALSASFLAGQLVLPCLEQSSQTVLPVGTE